jgi:hypothetical protein
VERSIDPRDTDSAINVELVPHIAINPAPSVTARNILFVMLPGTGATPNTYREVVRTGAPLGFHTIGLSYPNDNAVNGLCGQSNDPDCAGNVREEVLFGTDTSPLVNVNRANSIVNRLVALLRYLNSNFPNEGWGQYLNGSDPDWSQIRVGGHSQGSGHAAFLGKRVLLDRAVMFSGPGDLGPNGGAARWLTLPAVTPAGRYYGFTHTADPLVSFGNVTGAWVLLGLADFGPLVSVDNAVPPYGNTRRLTTSAPPNPNPTGPTASPAHGAPVADSVTPRDAQGQPIYRSVWTYLVYGT